MTHRKSQLSVWNLGTASLLVAATVTVSASAAEGQAEASFEGGFTADTGVTGPEGGAGQVDDSSAFLLAGKVGGIIPFNALGPFVAGGIELGWVFGGTERRIAALLDVSYTAPRASGTEAENRMPNGTFDWKLTQKELVFQPTFLYRYTALGDWVPFAGIGPRIYLLESVVEGDAAGSKLEDTQEQSTKFGVGIPLGVEYQLGPGGIMAELLFQWAPINHRTTGDSHLMAATIFLGYRALL